MIKITYYIKNVFPKNGFAKLHKGKRLVRKTRVLKGRKQYMESKPLSSPILGESFPTRFKPKNYLNIFQKVNKSISLVKPIKGSNTH